MSIGDILSAIGAFFFDFMNALSAQWSYVFRRLALWTYTEHIVWLAVVRYLFLANRISSVDSGLRVLNPRAVLKTIAVHSTVRLVVTSLIVNDISVQIRFYFISLAGTTQFAGYAHAYNDY